MSTGLPAHEAGWDNGEADGVETGSRPDGEREMESGERAELRHGERSYGSGLRPLGIPRVRDCGRLVRHCGMTKHEGGTWHTLGSPAGAQGQDRHGLGMRKGAYWGLLCPIR